MSATRRGVAVLALVVGAVALGPLDAVATRSESPKQFLDKLATALREGDTKFLVQRLHPQVIKRYGKDDCRTYVAGLQDATAAFVVLEVGAPESFDYASAGKTAAVAKTRPVTVLRTRQGTTSPSIVHITQVAGRYRWFAACSTTEQPDSPSATDLLVAAVGPFAGTYEGTWNDTRFNVNGAITIEAALDETARTLTISMTFTGPLFGATAPATEQLAPINLDITTFGTPVTGVSRIFGPYTVTYDATGQVTISMPECPPGSCTLTGKLTPGHFSGSVSVALRDGTTSQGAVELTKKPVA